MFWTGLGSLFKHDKKLMGQSSLHMFPIYGSAIIIPPIHRLIRKANVFIRGTIYALCIFLTEFISGSFLKKRNACPWDYSDAALNYKGIIRLDYAPVWFIVGLMVAVFAFLLNKVISYRLSGKEIKALKVEDKESIQ